MLRAVFHSLTPRGSSTAIAAVALVSVFLLAACTSEGDNDGQTIDEYLEEQGIEDPGTEDPGDPNEDDLSNDTTSDSGSGADPTPSSTSSTTEPVPTEKPLIDIPTEWDNEWEEVKGRYLLYWDAYAIATGLPSADADYEPLRQLTSPSAFEDLEEELLSLAAQKTVVINPEDSVTEHNVTLPNATVLSKVEGNEVVIQDCYVNGLVAQSESGEVQDDSLLGYLLNVKMEVIDGEWRVAAVRPASPESAGYTECESYVEQLDLPASYSSS